LTGLRFFAAAMVFAFHALRYGEQELGNTLFLSGATGVSFFFIVSGFVMSWTAMPDDTAWRFYRRRFARIYPAYAVAWVMSLGIMLIQGRRPSLVDLLPLTMTQSWVPSESVYWATNAVFWTLSVEAFFYLMFPLLLRVLGPLSVRGMLIAIVVVVLAVAGLTIGLAPVWGGSLEFWLLAVFPVTRLAEFVLGMLLGLLLLRGARWDVPLGLAVGVAVGAFLIANHVPPIFRDIATTLVPYALLVWAAASADMTGRASLLRAKPLVLLGTWSYAFYLMHTQAMTVWFEVLDRVGIDKDTVAGHRLLLAVLGAFACAVVAGFLLHRLVEAPMERRLRPAGAPVPVSHGDISRSGDGPAMDSAPDAPTAESTPGR
jgi:peptidoglycan/LPS O-acetylase OafA/YrhL